MIYLIVDRLRRFYKSLLFPISLSTSAILVYFIPHEGREILGWCIHISSGAIATLAFAIQIKRQARFVANSSQQRLLDSGK